VEVVVTGGAGFIGSNLGHELLTLSDVDEVAALDDLSTGFRANLDGTGIRLLEGTILDPDALDAACEGADAVVHLAALPSVPRSVIDPVASHHASATGTLEVLQAARRAGDLHVVIASSSSVHGANRELPKREGMRTALVSPYAVSKQATEAYAMSFGHTYGLPTLAFRFFNVYGPLQAAGHAYAAVIPAFVDSALRGEALTIHGDGEQTRDFTYVGTVTRVLADAVTRRVTDLEPVNLAFGTRTSLNALVDELAALLGHRPAVDHVEQRAGDVRDSQADHTRLRHRFPDVEPVPLREKGCPSRSWRRWWPVVATVVGGCRRRSWTGRRGSSSRPTTPRPSRGRRWRWCGTNHCGAGWRRLPASGARCSTSGPRSRCSSGPTGNWSGPDCRRGTHARPVKRAQAHFWAR